MGKQSILRLALAVTVFGTFLLPPTESFAAKNWFEKLFAAPKSKAPKQRKPRPTRTRVATPLTAPVPEPKPDLIVDQEVLQSPNVIPAPKVDSLASAPSTNGTNKLSEHAFGNALDIASFTLSGGTTVAVEMQPENKPAIFLDKVRKAACGPFKTVLGPGNPDHSEHFHFDLAPRRHGGTVCR